MDHLSEQNQNLVMERKIRTAQQSDIQIAIKMALDLYGGELYGFVFNCTDSRANADEVFSTICENACKGFLDFSWQSSLRTWLYTIAKHAVSKYTKEVKRQRKFYVSLNQVPNIYQLAESARTNTAIYLQTGVKKRARQLRRQLPLSDQILLILKVDRGLSWREVVQVLDESRGNGNETSHREQRFRKQFQRAKSRFRQLAEQDGLLKLASK